MSSVRSDPKIPICDHGNLGSAHHSRAPVHRWTRVYWPLGLLGALISFFTPFLSSMGLTAAGIGLAVGAGLLGLPELACVVTNNYQDTFSDWVWNTAHITGTLPMNRWNAGHFLLMGSYLLVSGSVNFYLFTLTSVHWQVWLLFASSCYFGVWLMFHFFFRWWT